LKIIRLGSSGKGYGGNIYESYIDSVLLGKFDYEVVRYEFRLKGFFRILELPFFLRFCWKTSRNKDFFVIRNFNTAFFPLQNPRNGLTIVYHVDEKGSKFLVGLYQMLLESLFIRKPFFSETVVVIAQFWHDFLKARGFTDLKLIYCPYEIEKYSTTEVEIQRFKEKYQLDSRPLVYLGNPQVKKGFYECQKVLDSKKLQLVTTGEGGMNKDGKHLKLSFSEYINLLAAADVVLTMSLFKEGWCRVAHEAMLLGTPVIGTGLGGMGELLKNSGGLFCESFHHLPAKVDQVLRDKKSVKINQDYLRSFSISSFEKQWLKLLSEKGLSIQ
jgi:glycosyltransferase involved in cell wall biosynthesis